ncbi:MAG: GNAT family N-acetyltransferase [Vicinamibacterales bacterium]
MVVRPWHDAASSEVKALYAAETSRWARELQWDIAPQWATVEIARGQQQLPGFIARSAGGNPVGWSFHLLHRHVLQVGALVASEPAITARLVEAILASREARAAASVMMFGYFDAPGLGDILRRRGLGLEGYRYLRKPIEPAAAGPAFTETYDHSGALAMADLLAASYPAIDPLRPFARNGHHDEWVEYVAQLTCGDACGVFDPALSPVARSKFGGFEGAALVTRVSPRVAHLAQVAVHPVSRGRQIGRHLVTSAVAAAQQSGCDSVTLLVSERNEYALRLYERLGFEETGRDFCAAGRI